ncbi:hypothetical protein VTP01DRAFT_4511 [Rhizomucor pusillus]|uniref:uncharacterized protein n=1 Tax=Rhizomucor pusillus TaxID=4840 RepID=UPI003744A245
MHPETVNVVYMFQTHACPSEVSSYSMHTVIKSWLFVQLYNSMVDKLPTRLTYETSQTAFRLLDLAVSEVASVLTLVHLLNVFLLLTSPLLIIDDELLQDPMPNIEYSVLSSWTLLARHVSFRAKGAALSPQAAFGRKH